MGGNLGTSHLDSATCGKPQKRVASSNLQLEIKTSELRQNIYIMIIEYYSRYLYIVYIVYINIHMYMYMYMSIYIYSYH